MTARSGPPQDELQRVFQERRRVGNQDLNLGAKMKCFNCRISHKACKWGEEPGMPLYHGQPLPSGKCNYCAKGRDQLEPCIPTLFTDLTPKQRLIVKEQKFRAKEQKLREAEENRKQVKQPPGRRQRSKSLSDSGREDHPPRRRPRSENYYDPSQFRAGTALRKEQRHAQPPTQSLRINPRFTTTQAETSTNSYPKVAEVATSKLVGFFDNPPTPGGSRNRVAPGWANVPPRNISVETIGTNLSNELSYLAKQYTVPMGQSWESVGFYQFGSPANWPDVPGSPSYMLSQHETPATSSSSFSMSGEQPNTNAGLLQLASQSSRDFRSSTDKKGESPVPMQGFDVVADLSDEEEEAETNESSGSSDTSILSEFDLDLSSEPILPEYSSACSADNQEYQNKRDARQHQWYEYYQQLNQAWPLVRKAKKKAARHQRNLQEALLLVKTPLYGIYRLAKLADQAKDNFQAISFRNYILVQLKEHNLWFQGLKDRVRSELLEAEARNRKSTRRSSHSMPRIPHLHRAVRGRDPEAIRACVHEYGGVNDEGPTGETALGIAVDIGDIDIATLLIEELQADVNVQNTSSGPTPLHIAILRRQYNMVKLLLRKNARVDIWALLDKAGPPVMAAELAAYVAAAFEDNQIQMLIKKKSSRLEQWILGRLDEPQRSLIPPNIRELITGYHQQPSCLIEVDSSKNTGLHTNQVEEASSTLF